MSTATCNSCGRNYTITREMSGKKIRCTNCGTTFQAPLVSDAVPVATEPLAATSSPPVRQYVAPNTGRKKADEIDYQIVGDDLQYVEVTLDPNETVIAEAGAMMYMSPAIRMETVFGDPSQKGQGFWSKVASAGKRMITGESLFMTTFTNAGGQREVVAFAAPYPGRIMPMHLDLMGGELICQKDAFLCGARGVQVSIAFQKKIGVGLFGGEGFIMQRLNGDGVVMIHASGGMLERQLGPGETLKLDTGCLVALTPSVTYDIQFVGGFKNTLFGGEGLFLATVTGPGHVWLQSLPFSRLAGRILSQAPGGLSSRKEEGSLLGSLGSLVMGGGND